MSADDTTIIAETHAVAVGARDQMDGGEGCRLVERDGQQPEADVLTAHDANAFPDRALAHSCGAVFSR